MIVTGFIGKELQIQTLETVFEKRAARSMERACRRQRRVRSNSHSVQRADHNSTDILSAFVELSQVILKYR